MVYLGHPFLQILGVEHGSLLYRCQHAPVLGTKSQERPLRWVLSHLIISNEIQPRAQDYKRKEATYPDE